MKKKFIDYIEETAPGNLFDNVEVANHYGSKKWSDETTFKDLKNIVAGLNKSGEIRSMSKQINKLIKLAIDLGYSQAKEE